MRKEPYVRKHASCPFCERKPIIKIWENSEREDNVWYIRHFLCPYCGSKVELAMHEYYNDDNLFQRNVDLRKPREVEDSEDKTKQRPVKTHPQ